MRPFTIQQKLTFKLTSRSISLKFIFTRNPSISPMPFNGSDSVNRRSRLWWLGWPWSWCLTFAHSYRTVQSILWLQVIPSFLCNEYIGLAVVRWTTVHSQDVLTARMMCLVDSTYHDFLRRMAHWPRLNVVWDGSAFYFWLFILHQVHVNLFTS